MTLLAIMAGIALCSVVGLYGVIGHRDAANRGNLARLALGASRSGVRHGPAAGSDRHVAVSSSGSWRRWH
jgi:hypothetical protein